MPDIETRFPELADHRTTATRLRPRRGEPGVRESSVGGPLLWSRWKSSCWVTRSGATVQVLQAWAQVCPTDFTHRVHTSRQ